MKRTGSVDTCCCSATVILQKLLQAFPDPVSPLFLLFSHRSVYCIAQSYYDWHARAFCFAHSRTSCPMYIKGIEGKYEISWFLPLYYPFSIYKLWNVTRMKEGPIVWIQLIELHNDNYISSLAWAMEKVFHIFLVVLTHLFESYYICIRDKENWLLRVLLCNIKCFMQYRKKAVPVKCFLTSFKITQTQHFSFVDCQKEIWNWNVRLDTFIF